jgi:dolichyl-phosphate-mannose-protein mannosyltransferase
VRSPGKGVGVDVPRASTGELAVVLLGALGLAVVARADAFRLLPYWDELGQYVPYARTLYQGTLAVDIADVPMLPVHPPLFYLLIALAAKIVGWSMAVVRAVTFVAAGFYLAGTYALARTRLPVGTALLVALALLASPVVLSEIGLAQADLPMAAFGLWSLVALERGARRWSAALFALGVMSNATLVALAPAWMWHLWRNAPRDDRWRRVVVFFLPTAVLGAAWVACTLALSHALTAQSAEAYRYNGIFLQGATAMGKRFAHRLIQLFVVDVRWPLTAGIVAVVVRGWRRGRLELSTFGGTLAGMLAAETIFLTFFGVTHQRYLLAALPALYVLGGMSVCALRPREGPVLLLAIAAASLATWHTSPTKFSSLEYRSAYRDQVSLMEEVSAELRHGAFAGAPIVTQWPMTSAWTHPYLGFVDKPLAVVDFDRDLDRMAQQLDEHVGPRLLVTLADGVGPETTEAMATLAQRFGPARGECQDRRLGQARMTLCEF